MSPLPPADSPVWCEVCRTEALDCEHLSDSEYLGEQLSRLHRLADMDMPERPYKEFAALIDKIDRLQERHHRLTRRPNCDCHLCRERGWCVPVVAKSESEYRKSLEEFLANPHDDDWLSCSDPFGALNAFRIRHGICNPDGTPHGPMCICDSCMEKLDRDDRTFWVVDGKAIVVHAHELDEFRRAYPHAREVL